MTEYAVLLVAALALMLALAVCVWPAAEYIANRRTAVRQRVLVNLHTGQAISGVLWQRRGRLLVIRDASLIEPGQSRATPMDGQVLVDRDQVALVQQRFGG